ncbi:hypothetical protein GCM10023185_28240 [Hymenobacter saemangeumensis]|uniref:Insertion element IS402-like domain-containing protein n=1 Tax=Hymenobacter saemangeumensis TaxID=1084522 RepID=A0ABP8IK88_9BACT
MRRHELSDREWHLIEPHTLGQPGTRGGTGRDNRLFVTAVFYRTRTGIPWRDLPARFGQWNTIARRFRRWALAGVWETVFRAVQEPDYEWVLVDSTTVKAHKAAAGQKKARRAPNASGAAAAASARRSTP